MQTNTHSQRSDMACVILSGGQSSRFGSDKALAETGGKRLVDLLISRLQQQTCGPIAINAPSRDGYELSAHPFIKDTLEGDIGPLSGLHAALCWAEANGLQQVVTTPVDTPILPDDFIRRLDDCGAPAVAQSGGRLHVLHGLWPVHLKAELEQHISQGMHAAHAWVEAVGAKACVFPDARGGDPFFNVNTPEDLVNLREILKP